MDVNETDTTAEFDPADAFARLWTEDAPKEPSEKEQEQPTEATETDETESDSNVQDKAETDDDASHEDEAKDEDTYIDNDDVKVKVKVDGEDREFAIKDLKRLAGQEASLTRKSQEVSTRRKQLDEIAVVQASAYEKLVQRARERWEPFTKIDFLTEARRLDDDQLQALRAEAQHRYDELQFLESEAAEFAKHVQAREHASRIEAARECVKVLSDPVEGIEGWGEPLYNEMRAFAKTAGVPASAVDNLTDPAMFKLLHKAMLYDKGLAKVSQQQQQAKGKKPAPKKIVKTSVSPQAAKEATGNKADAAMERLRKTGSRDDAVEAFMARWTSNDD